MINSAPTHKLDRVRRRIRRQWSAIGIATAAALGAVWYLLCLHPAADKLDALRAEIDDSYRILATETDLVDQLQQAATGNKQVKQHLEKLVERSATPPDEIAFLGWMSHQAVGWSLSLTDFRPGGPVEYGDFQGRSLQIAGRGGFEGICRMLHALRERPQMSRVSAFTLTPVDDARTRFDFAIKLELLQGVDRRAAENNGANPNNA